MENQTFLKETYQHVVQHVYQMNVLAISTVKIKHSKPQNSTQYGVYLLATTVVHHLESWKLVSCIVQQKKHIYKH